VLSLQSERPICPVEGSFIRLGTVRIAEGLWWLSTVLASGLDGERWVDRPAFQLDPMYEHDLDPAVTARKFLKWHKRFKKLKLTEKPPRPPGMASLVRTREYDGLVRPVLKSSRAPWDRTRRLANGVLAEMEEAQRRGGGRARRRSVTLAKKWKEHPWLLLLPEIIQHAWPGASARGLDPVDAGWMLTHLKRDGRLKNWPGRGTSVEGLASPSEVDLLLHLAEHPELEAVKWKQLLLFTACVGAQQRGCPCETKDLLGDLARSLERRLKRQRAARWAQAESSPSPLGPILLPDAGVVLKQVQRSPRPDPAMSLKEEVLLVKEKLASLPSRPPVWRWSDSLLLAWLRSERAMRMLEVIAAGERANLEFQNCGETLGFEEFCSIRSLPFHRVRALISKGQAGWPAVAPFIDAATFREERRRVGARRLATVSDATAAEVPVHQGASRSAVRVGEMGFAESIDSVLQQLPGYPDVEIVDQVSGPGAPAPS